MLKGSSVNYYIESVAPSLRNWVIHVMDSLGALVCGCINHSKFFNAEEVLHETVGEITPLVHGKRLWRSSELLHKLLSERIDLGAMQVQRQVA